MGLPSWPIIRCTHEDENAPRGRADQVRSSGANRADSLDTPDLGLELEVVEGAAPPRPLVFEISDVRPTPWSQ
jgi:hypothetical protein